MRAALTRDLDAGQRGSLRGGDSTAEHATTGEKEPEATRLLLWGGHSTAVEATRLREGPFLFATTHSETGTALR